MRVHAVFWNSLGRGSVAYTVNELLDNMPPTAVDRKLWSLSRDPDFPREFHKPALPELLYRALCKVQMPPSAQAWIAREIALPSVKPGDIVYMWPPYDLQLIRRAQDRGAIVVAERINCMGGLEREVLARAYGRRGLPLPVKCCTPKKIEKDREQMMQCDFVTAPNPFVTQSITSAGIANDRILETSYGFNPARLAKAIDIQRPDRTPTFAFVGLGIVRKGFDVLLEAWDKAQVNAQLLIAGHIDDDLRGAYARTLARPDIQELGYVQDIASVYAAADVFIFPTHEEGGPQVTYEAAACGLPSIVSPMGAGRIVRDGMEGIFVNPLDVASVADAITRLADDREVRLKLGANAGERAREFTWGKVSARLYDLFCSVRPNSPNRSAH